jgi:ABC-type lipoprotein release transport system permease subunit
MEWRMAWRNIWRNRRRTLVVLAAVVLGVWCMVAAGAYVQGLLQGLRDNAVATLTGHVQVHAPGYVQDPGVAHSMPRAQALLQTLDAALPPGSSTALRVRVNAVLQTTRRSAGVTLVGVQPEAEARVSFIGNAVRQGAYLDAGGADATGGWDGILLGAALADTLRTEQGKRVVLMAQDANGEIASRAFVVRGLYRAELEATEQQYAFVTVDAAQDFLKLDGAVSEAVALLPPERGAQDAPAVARDLEDALSDTPGGPYEVRHWRALQPVVAAYLEIMDWFMLLWYLVVFVAMGFGIVNTMLMAVLERVREFGLLKALGMRGGRITRLVLAESLCILVLGTALGDLLGWWTSLWLAHVGIDLSSLAEGAEHLGLARVIYPRFSLPDMLLADALVLVLGLLVSLYPAVKAARFTPVEAMRHT